MTTTMRMNRDLRPIVHDSRFPVAGGRDRRRGGARDDGPLEARAALQDHMQRSMGQENYQKGCALLDYLVSALLGPNEGEGDPSAMDGRVLDHRQGQLTAMFAAAPNPSAHCR